MCKLLEDQKMAIIDLTCEYPNKYSITSLARWAKVDNRTVRRLVVLLDLDIKRGSRSNRSRERVGQRLSDFVRKRKPIMFK
jgi:hypothetical protein